MKSTSLSITTQDTKEKYKVIQEINFYLEEELIVSYSCLITHCMKIDFTDRTIWFEDTRKFHFASYRQKSDKDDTCVFVSNKVFLKLLCYCTADMKFDASLSEKEEMVLIADMFKQLF